MNPWIFYFADFIFEGLTVQPRLAVLVLWMRWDKTFQVKAVEEGTGFISASRSQIVTGGCQGRNSNRELKRQTIECCFLAGSQGHASLTVFHFFLKKNIFLIGLQSCADKCRFPQWPTAGVTSGLNCLAQVLGP